MHLGSSLPTKITQLQRLLDAAVSCIGEASNGGDRSEFPRKLERHPKPPKNGSAKNGCISNIGYLSNIAILHHDCGKKNMFVYFFVERNKGSLKSMGCFLSESF